MSTFPKNFKLVLGLGKTGLSTAKFLYKKNIPFVVNDTRETLANLDEIKELLPGVEIVLGGISTELLNKAEEIIISPGVDPRHPEIQQQVQHGKSLIGDVELFLRYCQAPICAITGSNAKSTVTTLVYEMAKAGGINAKLGGNIGVPVLEHLDEASAELYVLELSSFQLETVSSLKAKAATILNISPDHMDRYDSLQDYIAAKQRIYEGCETAVINRNDINTFVDNAKLSNVISFGLNEPETNQYGLIENQGQTYLAKGTKLLLNVNELTVPGMHYWENALAALALGEACGLSMNAMIDTLKTFKGLPHRCQLIAETNQVKWYNDSKGTNEGATAAAIEGIGKIISGKIILIAGGVGKGADFLSLQEPVESYVSHTLLIGEASQQLEKIFEGLTEIIQCKSLEEAVLQANQIAKSGDAVLLSPACASFDMFQNFEKRGEAFVAAVYALLAFEDKL